MYLKAPFQTIKLHSSYKWDMEICFNSIFVTNFCLISLISLYTFQQSKSIQCNYEKSVNVTNISKCKNVKMCDLYKQIPTFIFIC